MSKGSTDQKLATFVVLCRNEVRYIERCVRSLAANREQYSNLEIIVVDGMSDDGTRDVLQGLLAELPFVRVEDNPLRITPAAFNIGITKSAGRYILPAGAHCVYPPHYCHRLITALEASGADNVGGHCRTVPANSSSIARGIAAAMSHPIGVGNALFRLAPKEARWVDTVPFGCYRRELFDRIGLFDESLQRNQDDEFNHRLRSKGGSILLIPDVQVDYVARSTLGQLRRTFWQYGLFKPLAALKVGTLPTLRQLVPPAFVVLLVLGVTLSPFVSLARLGLCALASAYLIAIGGAAFSVAGRSGAAVGASFSVAVVTMHLSYGSGWITGLVHILTFSRSGRGEVDIGISR